MTEMSPSCHVHPRTLLLPSESSHFIHSFTFTPLPKKHGQIILLFVPSRRGYHESQMLPRELLYVLRKRR